MRSLAIVLIAHCLFVPMANAVVIDFEALNSDDDEIHFAASPYIEDGFRIANNVGGPTSLGYYGRSNPHFAGSTGLFSNLGLQLSLAHGDANEFSVASIGLSSLFDTTAGGSRLIVTMKGTRRDGTTITYEINEPKHFGFLTYELSAFTDIIQLSWDQSAFGSVPHQFDNIVITMGTQTQPLKGDFDRDEFLTVDDLNQLTDAIHNGASDIRYDLNENGAVDTFDRIYWIQTLKVTDFGDANLDGQFDSTDLIEVFQAGEFADSIAGNSTWSEGDFGGDFEFDTDDLVLAFQTGTYENAPNAVAVPEPSILLHVALPLIGWARRRIRQT